MMYFNSHYKSKDRYEGHSKIASTNKVFLFINLEKIFINSISDKRA
jgi:hypothetical protein